MVEWDWSMVGLDWSSGAPLSYPAEIEKSSHIYAIFFPKSI